MGQMVRKLLMLGMAAMLAAGCAGSGEQEGTLDYDTLENLEHTLVTEIGETEEYLPGQFSSLAVDSRGRILAWDRSKITIEQFDAEGNHLATVATEGNGPGEITQNSRIAGIPGDTLMVSFPGANQYALFTPGENGIYTFLESVNFENPHSGSMNLQGSRSVNRHFLTTRVWNFGNMEQYSRDAPGRVPIHVDLVDLRRTILRDSLHMMNLSNPIIEMSESAIAIYSGAPYQYEDQLRVFGDGSYVIARADSAALHFYNADHSLRRKMELNVIPRPVGEEDREYGLRDYNSDTREKMLARIPETKPPFLDFWTTEERIWMHTDNGEEGREMVVLTLDGEPVGRFYLGESETVHAVDGKRLYVVDNESERGSVIRIYEVEI